MSLLTQPFSWLFHLRGNFGRWWAVTPTWRASLILAAGLALLGFAAWCVGSPAYGLFRKRMVEHNSRQAVVAAAAGDWERARDLALSVVLTGDRRIEVLRVVVDSMRRLDDRRLDGFANALIAHPECASADRLAVFQWRALNEPLGRVWLQWQRLPTADRASLPFRLALVDRFIQDGDHARVSDFLKDYTTPETPPEVTARVIRDLIGQATPGSLELAQAGLADQVTRHPDGPVDWLELLESLPVASLDEFTLEPLRPWLKAGRPGQPGRGELVEARIHLQAVPEADRDPIVAEAVASWASSAPHALCRLLIAVDRLKTLAEVFTDEKVAGDAELVKARLDTLIRLGRVKELATSLAQHESSLRPIELFAYQAVAADRAGNAAERTQFWNRVVTEGITSPKPDDLLRQLAFARRFGLSAEAERTLLEALKEGRGPLPSYESLKPQIKSLEEKGQEHDLMTILAAYLAFEPWNPELLCRHSYLAVMLGIDPPAVGNARVAKLLESNAGNGHAIAVLATLQLLGGEAEAAGETWKLLPFSPDDLAPTFRAAHLITQVDAGTLDPAAAVLKGIPWESLLPCERTNLNKILLDHQNRVPMSKPVGGKP